MTKREFRVTARLSRKEREALERLARVGGDVTHADVIRALLRREARERGVWPAQEQQPEGVRRA